MLETTINEVLTKDTVTNKIFLGVFARDELPLKVKYPSCLIFNTAPRINKGEHWLALHYNEKGFCNFFDSYGKDPSKFLITDYIEKTSTDWNYNKKRIQGSMPYCGHYCVFYLLFKARGKDLAFFNNFGLNYLENDKEISKLIDNFE
jgi:hypothetical protein